MPIITCQNSQYIYSVFSVSSSLSLATSFKQFRTNKPALLPPPNRYILTLHACFLAFTYTVPFRFGLGRTPFSPSPSSRCHGYQQYGHWARQCRVFLPSCQLSKRSGFPAHSTYSTNPSRGSKEQSK